MNPVNFTGKGMKMRKFKKITSQADQKKIQEFLNLKSQSVELLQERARDLNLDDSGDVTELARRISKYSLVEQVSIQPQAFALKSQSNTEAQQFMRRANARILPQDLHGRVVKSRVKKRAFLFADKKGKQYSADCPFVQLRNETAQLILDKEWIYPLDNQKELISEMRSNINKFNCSLIRKQTSSDGKFYLMLHSELKD